MFRLRHRVVEALLVLAFVAPARAGLAADAARSFTPRALGPYDRHVVGRAVQGARARLSTPECQGLLDEFADPEGVSLRSRLSESGSTLADRLAQVRFFDGSESWRCQSTSTYAFTTRASAVVCVCPRLLAQAVRLDPHADLVIIHELLHSLGLGENPPHSSDITARVAARCFARP